MLGGMDGIELMAQAMHAAHARLDVSASNLANVSSGAFRRRVARVQLGPAGLSVSAATDAKPGPLERTGRPLDLAVAGPGAFFVRDRAGTVSPERSASFVLDSAGNVRDERGRALLGAHGPVRADASTTLDARGIVRDGAGRAVDRLRLAAGTSLQTGFLERSNVDAVREMVDVLGAQRAFETAQKTLSAIDDTRAKAVNELAKVSG
jgi:flagellar basal body rod protein FlgG